MDKERDDIEKLILDNLEGLNSHEPADGHFGRFEAKLNRQSRKGKATFRLIWRVAAAVIFVFLAVNQAIIYLSPDKEEIITLGSISPEYKEVEFYYTNAINNGLEQWEGFNNAGLLTEEDTQMMETELEEFDTILKNLQEELNANPNDERVINAMLEYYQSKLNVITLIIDKLQEVKKQKVTNHEIEI